MTVRKLVVPTLTELAKMCEIANPYMKAWICCQKDSGLPTHKLISLRFSNLSSEFGTIESQLQNGIVPIHIRVKYMMTNLETDCFFGSNAIEALNEYKEANQREGPIFDKISVRALHGKLKRLSVKVGVMDETYITPYSIRKFFYTRMRDVAKIPQELVEHWIGHVGVCKHNNSFGISVNEMAEAYMKAYKYIDIMKIQ